LREDKPIYDPYKRPEVIYKPKKPKHKMPNNLYAMNKFIKPKSQKIINDAIISETPISRYTHTTNQVDDNTLYYYKCIFSFGTQYLTLDFKKKSTEVDVSNLVQKVAGCLREKISYYDKKFILRDEDIKIRIDGLEYCYKQGVTLDIRSIPPADEECSNKILFHGYLIEKYFK
jgi:hypothetical protein